MAAFVAWVRSEPVLIAGFVSIVATLALTLTNNNATAGSILSAVEAVLALIVRSQVTPTVKLAGK